MSVIKKICVIFTVLVAANVIGMKENVVVEKKTAASGVNQKRKPDSFLKTYMFVNRKDVNGNTALHFLIDEMNKESDEAKRQIILKNIKAFMAISANPLLKNNDELSPWDMACTPDVKEALECNNPDNRQMFEKIKKSIQ